MRGRLAGAPTRAVGGDASKRANACERTHPLSASRPFAHLPRHTCPHSPRRSVRPCARLQFVCEGANILTFDRRRAAAMTAFSGLYMGGFCHFVFATYAPFSVAVTNALRRVRDKALGKVSFPGVVKPSAFAEGCISSLAENLMHVPFL